MLQRALIRSTLLLLSASALIAQSDPSHGFAINNGPPPPLPVTPAPRAPIFFPPIPPALGTSLASDVIDLRLVAPPELRAFVGEYFYPALSTLYAEQQLGSQLEQRLASYLAARRQLEEELKNRMAAIGELSANQQGSALTQLAAEQTDGLSRLESTAEQLRRDLIAKGTTWNALRQIRLDELDKKYGPGSRRMSVSDIVRAAAYYAVGPTTIQRDLLLEIAIELTPASLAATGPIATAGRQMLFFLPAPARIFFPTNSSPELQTKVTAFVELRNGLKKELHEVVQQTDLATPKIIQSTWERVAAAQSDRLAALERQAEELRTMFAATRIDLAPAPALKFPTEFVARFNHYRQASRAYDRDLFVAIERVRRTMLTYQSGADEKNVRITTAPIFNGTGPPIAFFHAYSFVNPLSALPEQRAVFTAVRDEIAGYHTKHKTQREELAAEESVLATELTNLLGHVAKGPPLATLQVFEQLADQDDAWLLYDEYRIAVLQPGLSPAQRRLLFRTALSRLTLPLPGGELQPRDG